MGGDGDLLRSQIAYYRRRAGEYDRTAYGTDLAAARARIATLLDLLQPEGLVLEIACGTGMWTEQLVGRSDLVVGLDAAQEAVALARNRVGPGAGVALVVADVFTWQPRAQFDTVVMAFWLSHVPAARWVEFLTRVGDWVLPGGRVLIVDEHLGRRSSEQFGPDGDDTAIRTLDDGSEHHLVKVFVDPPQLEILLGTLGWDCTWWLDHGWVALSAVRADAVQPLSPVTQ